MVDRPERAGYVARVRGTVDRRAVSVRMTEQAWAEAEALFGPVGGAAPTAAERSKWTELSGSGCCAPGTGATPSGSPPLPGPGSPRHARAGDPTPMSRVGIVLAGGRSSRMGVRKAALEWHGSTLLRRTVGMLARRSTAR